MRTRSKHEELRDTTATTTSDVGRATLTQRYTHAGSADEHASLDAAWARGVASHGISDGGQALPHLATIQASFGPHDVSGVSAHVGGRAGEASEALGAHGYATGDHVAFAQSPDLF